MANGLGADPVNQPIPSPPSSPSFGISQYRTPTTGAVMPAATPGNGMACVGNTVTPRWLTTPSWSVSPPPGGGAVLKAGAGAAAVSSALAAADAKRIDATVPMIAAFLCIMVHLLGCGRDSNAGIRTLTKFCVISTLYVVFQIGLSSRQAVSHST